jgi:iron(III) transport system permease protein
MTFWRPAVVLVAVLVAVPVLVVTGHLLLPAREVWSHLTATVLPRYVTGSLTLMLGVGAGTLLLGVATAWLVTMTAFPGRRVFEWALLMPLAVPAYVIAFTYTTLLEFGGPVQTWVRALGGWESAAEYWFPQIRSLPGAIAMMILVFYPYVYMLARAAFLEQAVCVLEASRTLGRSGWSTFYRVALPLARPAIAGGLALALMETLNDFGTVDFLAVDTFVTGIRRTWLGLGQPQVAAQLGATLMLFILALILLERWSRRGGTGLAMGFDRRLPRFPLSRRGAVAALVICSLPVLLGFVLPLVAMVIWTWQTRDFVSAQYVRMALTSLGLAAITAVIAVTVAVLLAYGRRLVPGRLTAMAVQVSYLGYAVPGAVIALGIMIPLGRLDHLIDDVTVALFDHSTGLLLTGTWAALIYAYVVRFLALAGKTVESSLQRVTPSMDGAARTLGHSATGTLRRVHLPLMRGSLLTAGVLVFVDVMKELPATFMMRPFGLSTLAIRSHELASDGLLKESASASLAIVLAGIVPVILASVMIARSRRRSQP